MAGGGREREPVAGRAGGSFALASGLDAVLLVTLSPDGTVAVDAANEAARELFAIDDLDRVDDAQLPALAAPLLARIRDAKTRGRATREQLALSAPDGSRVPVEVQFEAMPGRPEQVMAVVRAISEIDLDALERDTTAGVGLFRTERDVAAVFVDDALLQLLGLAHEQALGRGWLEAVHPDDRDAVARAFVEAVAREDTLVVDCRIVRPSGEERWARVRAVPVRGDDGRVTGCLGSIEDVTERRESELVGEQLAQLADAAQDLIGVCDSTWRLVYLNPAARAFVALGDRDDLHDVRVDTLVVERDGSPSLDAIRRDLERSGRWTGQLVMRSLDGRELDVDCTIVRSRGDGVTPDHYSFLGRDITSLREIEQALQRSEHRRSRGEAWFRSLVQNAPDLLAVLDADGTIAYVSPSVERLIGHTREELIGARLSSLLVDGDVDLSEVGRLIAERPGAPVALEGRLRHRDGSTRVFEGSITNLLHDPAVRGMVVNARDVTDRREAEDARLRSEAALRAVVQSSPLPICALDRRGALHVWNVACQRLFGWDARDVIGSRPPFVTDEDEFDSLLVRVFRGVTVTGHESVVQRADGSYLDVDVAVAPLRNASGRIVTAVLVLADVTEQKRAEAALRESEVRYRSLFQNSHDMVTVLDADGNVTFQSPSARAFLGGGFTTSARLAEVLAPEDLPAVAEAFVRLRSNPGSTEQLAFRLRPPGSEERTIEMVATNLLDDPAVRGIVTNSRDVTDRVRAEAAIRASEERLRALVASASDIIAVIDGQGHLQYSSPVAEQLLGYPERAGYGEDIFSLLHPDDRDEVVRIFGRARELRGMYRPLEARLRRADGSWMMAEIVANNLLDDPSVRGIVVTIRDVTERRRAEEALRESEQRLREGEARYRAVVDDQTELVCRYLPDTTLTFVNRAFADFYGYTPDELVGARLVDLFPTTDRARVLDRLRGFGPGNEVQTEEDWELAGDGSVHWYQWTDRAFLDERGEVVEFQSVGRDVTERRRAAAFTAHQAEILEQVARGLPLDATLATIVRTVEDHFPKLACAISLLDEDGMTLRVGAAPRLPGRVREALGELRIGPVSGSSGTAAYRRERVVVPDVRTDPLWNGLRDAVVAHGFVAAWSTPILASDGHTVLGTVDLYSREPAQPDEEQEQVVSLVAHLASIAIERKAFEDRLAHQSMHDPLTGLPNRLLFVDRLGLSVARCRRTRSEVAVLFLDLDRFKNVNDSVGHDAGDELLIAVARRLEAILRPGDTVARFGGDEFTILCEDLPQGHAREQAIDIAHRLLGAVAQPFIVRGAETFVSASVGIALGVGDERPEDLLRDADAAMYHAKEVGRGRVEVFDDTMRARALTRHATENALHRALERGELLLFFQPVVSLSDAGCVGAEALVRWQHPERGLVAPADFVPLAEETGLVVQLGRWVLEEAASQAARWQAEHGRPFVVSVNLSARQLAQPDLAASVGEVIERTGVDPADLCLEITESVLMDDAQTVLSAIEEVRSLGVCFAIDDFGTGYSSLGYLKRFPVDRVKIDRSFVVGLGTDPGDAAIVSAVIGLAHALDLQVVAEGVETEEQLAELVALGCDEAQGFYFAPPQPIEDLRTLLGRSSRWRPPGSRVIDEMRRRTLGGRPFTRP